MKHYHVISTLLVKWISVKTKKRGRNPSQGPGRSRSLGLQIKRNNKKLQIYSRNICLMTYKQFLKSREKKDKEELQLQPKLCQILGINFHSLKKLDQFRQQIQTNHQDLRWRYILEKLKKESFYNWTTKIFGPNSIS